MKQKVIAVDCDDVLAETAPLILAHYNTAYGTQLKLQDMHSNDLRIWEIPDKATAITHVTAS